jgi:hypothetical protein
VKSPKFQFRNRNNYEMNILTINRTDIAPNDPLFLTNGLKFRHWRQNELATFVPLEFDIFGLLHEHRNFSIIIRIQFIKSELFHCPIFEIFVCPILPFVAGIGKRISDIVGTLDTINKFSGLSLGVESKTN